MDSIQRQIKEKLCRIENEQGIRIVLAVESGSRAWGFASPDSDYDCRFVYVRPQAFYLSVFTQKDTLDYVTDPVFDVSGWDVSKFIRHLVKSNAVMLEWLQSDIVYQREEIVTEKLWQLGRAFFNPVSTSWHYLSMARKKLEEIKAQDAAKLKTCFYILRPLACVRYIREYGEIPFMAYRRNLEKILVPKAVTEEIHALLAKKAEAGEARAFSVKPVLLDYFQQEIDEAAAWLKTQPYEKNKDYACADQCFYEILQRMKGDA